MCNCNQNNEVVSVEGDKETYYGEVIFFSKTYGFSTHFKNGVQQRDIFLHYSDILADGFRMLRQGQKISYNIGVNNFGAPKAINIRIISNP
jgi:CspA family cold shock protein